ncbi:hypothetical protein Q5692_21835, partial [Microcoleus sp. C2C3]
LYSTMLCLDCEPSFLLLPRFIERIPKNFSANGRSTFPATGDRSFGIGKRHRPVLFCRYHVENLINRTHAFFPKKPGFLPNLWGTTKDFAKKPGF